MLLRDVLSAYLSPLLKKHTAGKLLVYGDLISSMEAAKAVLKDSPNEFVLRKVNMLHETQVMSYNEAAKKALRQWSESFEIPAMKEDEATEAYVERCLSHSKASRPQWEVKDSIIEDHCNAVLRKRAQQVGSSKVAAQASENDEEGGEGDNDDNAEGGDEENEEGELEEDEEGEVAEEEMDADESGQQQEEALKKDGSAKTQKATMKKKTPLQNKKKVPVKAKNATIQKKAGPGNTKTTGGGTPASKKAMVKRKPQALKRKINQRNQQRKGNGQASAKT